MFEGDTKNILNVHLLSFTFPYFVFFSWVLVIDPIYAICKDESEQNHYEHFSSGTRKSHKMKFYNRFVKPFIEYTLLNVFHNSVLYLYNIRKIET
jgi:hypothetical protein